MCMETKLETWLTTQCFDRLRELSVAVTDWLSVGWQNFYDDGITRSVAADYETNSSLRPLHPRRRKVFGAQLLEKTQNPALEHKSLTW